MSQIPHLIAENLRLQEQIDELDHLIPRDLHNVDLMRRKVVLVQMQERNRNALLKLEGFE